MADTSPHAEQPQGAGNHVYDGVPDGRQSSDVGLRPSRFRPRYRALKDDEKALHDAIKAKAEELEALFNQVGPGPYTDLAMTSLEQAVIWSVKQLTS